MARHAKTAIALGLGLLGAMTLADGDARAQPDLPPIQAVPVQPKPVQPPAVPPAPAPARPLVQPAPARGQSVPTPAQPAPASAQSAPQGPPRAVPPAVPPPAATQDAGDELPFYRPSSAETAQLAPPAPPLPPAALIGSLLFDVFAFTSGTIRGAGNLLRARFGTSNAGLAVGLFNGGEAFSIGGDFFRYPGIPLKTGPTEIAILVPNLELEGMTGSSGTAFHAGTSLTGLRVAMCGLGPCALVFSVRGPTMGLWIGGNSSAFGGSPSLSFGASADVGLSF